MCDTTWVPVTTTVPPQRLAEWHALMADFHAAAGDVELAGGADSPLPGGTLGGDADDKPAEPWTVEELRKVAATPTKTTRIITAMLDVLAEQPEQHRGTTELVERLEVGRDSLRAALGAFTRHMRAHYPGHDWPMTWAWGPSLNPQYSAQQYYALSQELTDLWLQARA